MVTYSHKDIRVEINGKNLYCSNINFSYGSSFEPLYTINDKNTNEYSPSSPPRGSINLDYYLTGLDVFADFHKERTPHSINVGELSINSGFVNSYSLQVEPGNLLKASVGLSFFEKINGIFNPLLFKNYDLPDKVDILKSSEVSIEGGMTVKEGDVRSLGYNYSIEVDPSYTLENPLVPNDIKFGQKKIEVSASVYNYNLQLPPNGERENFQINIKDKNYNTVHTLKINSFIRSKSIDFNPENRPILSIQMGQANLGTVDGTVPSITDFTPKSGNVNSAVLLNGNNLLDIERVLLGDFRCEILGNISNTQVNVLVPISLYSGYKAPFVIKTYGGTEAFSQTGFLVTGGLTF